MPCSPKQLSTAMYGPGGRALEEENRGVAIRERPPPDNGTDPNVDKTSYSKGESVSSLLTL